MTCVSTTLGLVFWICSPILTCPLPDAEFGSCADRDCALRRAVQADQPRKHRHERARALLPHDPARECCLSLGNDMGSSDCCDLVTAQVPALLAAAESSGVPSRIVNLSSSGHQYTPPGSGFVESSLMGGAERDATLKKWGSRAKQSVPMPVCLSALRTSS